jgi:hypothetical protein
MSRKRALTWVLPLAAVAGIATSCGSTGSNSEVPGDDGGGADVTMPQETADAPSDDTSNPTTTGTDATGSDAEMDAPAADGAGTDAAPLDGSSSDAAQAADVDAAMPMDGSNTETADADAGHPEASTDGAVSDAAGASTPDASPDAAEASTPDASPDAAEAAAPDAGPFACHGAPLPTTAPASVSLSGSTALLTAGGLSPAAGVTVTALAATNDATIATTTSDASGAFSVTASTGGTPLDAYFHATKANIIDAYYYPVAPFAADASDVDFLLVTSATFVTVQALLGVTQSASESTLVVMVQDCNGNAVAGATVSTIPANTAVYYDGSNGLPSATASSTSTDGIAIVFNVAPGTVTVGAQAPGAAFRSHTVKARAGTLTLTRVAP